MYKAMGHLLSKSKYIRGLQCERALWLDVYNPREARYSADAFRRFDAGRTFEQTYKDTYPNAIDISERLKYNRDDYPQLTEELLDGEGVVDLFEAGFAYDDVLVLADVVHKREDGILDIYEVKGGREVTETFIEDAAVQYYVISQVREVGRFSLVCRGEGVSFSLTDVTEIVMEKKALVAERISAMKKVLAGGEPGTEPGEQCTRPYECPYGKHCAKGIRQLMMDL
jgi:hypothetical protein